MSRSTILALCALAALAPASLRAGEISASELAEKLKQPGPHPVLIDIRPNAEYQQGSIPGAINIPGRVLLQKKMRLAQGCVVISDGISDKVDPADLAAKLEQAGVSPADYLHGGMAAWTQLKDSATTHRVGAREGRGPRSITYQDLARRTGDTSLVDLRPAAERTVPEGHDCPVRGLCSEQKFRYFDSLESFHGAHRKSKGSGDTTPLIVLIGGKDTEIADTELEKLFIEGFHRSAILLGGADIIAHQGRRGLKRKSGKSITLPAAPPANP